MKHLWIGVIVVFALLPVLQAAVTSKDKNCTKDTDCPAVCSKGSSRRCDDSKCSCGAKKCTKDDECPKVCPSGFHRKCTHGNCTCEAKKCTKDEDCPQVCSKGTSRKCKQGGCSCEAKKCAKDEECPQVCASGSHRVCKQGDCSCQALQKQLGLPGSGSSTGTGGTGFPASTPASGFPSVLADSGFTTAPAGSGFPTVPAGSGTAAQPPDSGDLARTVGSVLKDIAKGISVSNVKTSFVHCGTPTQDGTDTGTVRVSCLLEFFLRINDKSGSNDASGLTANNFGTATGYGQITGDIDWGASTNNANTGAPAGYIGPGKLPGYENEGYSGTGYPWTGYPGTARDASAAGVQLKMECAKDDDCPKCLEGSHECLDGMCTCKECAYHME